jgi:GDPmannose 4,6-dehydratase
VVLSNLNRVIIFGANGQDGFYLSQLLRQHYIQVIGISRKGDVTPGDVSNFAFVERQIKQYQPGYIFHFAANSTTRHEALFDNHEAISTGTLNILESAKRHSPTAKIFLAGSAMQFRNEGLPIDEHTPFEAGSPYSVARIQSVYAGRYYRKAFGLQVYVGYFFNHDSPLRTERHINQKIVQAAKQISQGKSAALEIGDVNVRKEFNFAGDMMEAVWTLVNQDDIFEAVIGSGEAHSLAEWLELCFGFFGQDWRKFVTERKDFVAEYKLLVSNPALIKSLGWKPRKTWEDLANIMWRNTI